MSAAPVKPAPRRIRRGRAALVLVALAAVGVWQARVHLGAWGHLKDGRAALARDDIEGARRHLELCLREWPQSGEAHYLAAQTDRRAGDFDAALAHLKKADRYGRPAPDIEVEGALIKAQSGQFDLVEPALLHHFNEGHPEAPALAAVLVPAYMVQFRWGEAGAVSEKWVERCPDSLPAWRARAEALERLRRTDAAVEALRKVIELAPEDRAARKNFVRLVLETHLAPDEAVRHAEWLTRTDPRDPTALYQLAACRDAQGRTDEAAALLDRLIAEFPPDPKAYHLRGRLALARSAAAALPFLRRAAELEPSDPDVLYSHFLCLQQAGTSEQAAEAESRWRRCAADLKRVRELGRAISAAPHDPDLRCEMGELFLRNGRDAEGVRWLESALREAPAHAPAHRALAAHFERVGQPDQAARHRSSSGTGGRP